MINTLTARGRMFEISIKPISKMEFKELYKKGRKTELYKQLYEATTFENDLYGFQMDKGRGNLEMYLNGVSLELKKTLWMKYEITHLPVDGSIHPISGVQEYYFVSETGFVSGESELKFKGEYRGDELRFEVERRGLFDKTCSSILNPTYRGQYLSLIWNWSGYKNQYLITSKGKRYPLIN
ncbi:hypothetical protein ICN28_06160 [Polynucleobacter sp. 30F-ANTBAC]|uniref:hypothetical protein n=1 Tax=Polynucleobacter sp. 30F-ANTBAC TaxID=2689095 RepID=UPI001C0C1BB2|nr:hypothetical protein [Polynucleobacter sp. 30F-ANTBAC]MBU3600096.1 hypothetical protein [Polynucleobacter sp. 30F-ANTBAC]